jgi:hypothetical protein
MIMLFCSLCINIHYLLYVYIKLGAIYEGEFRFGVMHGRGRFQLSKGDLYEGSRKLIPVKTSLMVTLGGNVWVMTTVSQSSLIRCSYRLLSIDSPWI